MKRIFILLLLGMPVSNLFACLNGEHIKLQTGVPLYFDYAGSIPQGHRFIAPDQLRKEFKTLGKLYKQTKDLDYLSDQGLILIVLGEYDKAIELYQRIEKIEPGRYSTASNMGTTYELMGNNELALKWIQKAVAINPSSHYESEWIHVNILKYKLNNKIKLTSGNLIGMDFGTGDRPQSSLSQERLKKLADALFYQLNERISFIKPKDNIIAQLLFDYANVNILINDNSTAARCYEQALEYGFNGNLIDTRYKITLQRIKELDSIIIHQEMVKLGYGVRPSVIEEKQEWSSYTWGGGVFLIMLLTGSVLYIRKRKKAQR